MRELPVRRLFSVGEGKDMLLSDERLDVINESLSLIQKRNGLTFGTDAYLLYAYLRRAPHAKAADLGAGSGNLAIRSSGSG